MNSFLKFKKFWTNGTINCPKHPYFFSKDYAAIALIEEAIPCIFIQSGSTVMDVIQARNEIPKIHFIKEQYTHS